MPTLSLMERVDVEWSEGSVVRKLGELTQALGYELRLIEDLRAALLRQRQGVASDDPAVIEASVQAIGRTLLTLEEARRHRGALTALLTGGTVVPLGELEATLGRALPSDLLSAREAVRRAAQSAGQEVAINQTILRRAIEAGDAFLQQLFSSAADPMPAYTPAAATAEPRPAALLLDRTA